jgi:tRNA(fMet)-specific endonuclease VapC
VKYCLDTNIVIAALNGDGRVVHYLVSVPAHDIIVPLIVIAELLYGAQRSVRRDANLARVRQLAARFRIVPIDEAIVERYAVARTQVESKGRTKSDFDLLIACCATTYGNVLVTNDAALKDGAIEGLITQDWLE